MQTALLWVNNVLAVNVCDLGESFLNINRMKLFLHNFVMIEEGIRNPVIGLLKVGMNYPTPKGIKEITGILYGCIIFN